MTFNTRKGITADRTSSLGLAKLVAAVVMCVALAGCGKASPAQICASETTFDQALSIAVPDTRSWIEDAYNQLVPDKTKHQPVTVSLVKTVLEFTAPRLEAFDRETGKVTCNAILKLKLPRDWVPDLFARQGMVVTDLGNDQISVQMRYGAQPTADGGNMVYELQNPKLLAGLISRAFEFNLQKSVAGLSAQPQPSKPTGTPTASARTSAAVLANCHMDACSWFRIVESTVYPHEDGALHKVEFISGETPADDEDASHVKWFPNRRQADILCSLSNPSITTKGVNAPLALNSDGSSIPDVGMGIYAMYVAECHPEAPKLGPDALAKRFNYRARTG